MDRQLRDRGKAANDLAKTEMHSEISKIFQGRWTQTHCQIIVELDKR